MSVDSVLLGRAGAQLANDFPNDKQRWSGGSSTYKVCVSSKPLNEEHATDHIVLQIVVDADGNCTDMNFVTGKVTNVTIHQEKLGRAWPGLTFKCIEMNTTSV